MVIAKKSTQTLATVNGAAWARQPDAVDELIAEALMVAFAVIVPHKLREGMPQVPFTEQYEAVQALRFDRPNKPLRICVAIRGAKWCLDHPHT